jgi:hypothetical protein
MSLFHLPKFGARQGMDGNRLSMHVHGGSGGWMDELMDELMDEWMN